MKCCDIHSGRLQHRVRVERLTLADDGGGGSTETWSLIARPWAYIKPLSGTEALHGMQLRDKITHKIYMRYRDLTPRDRLIHRGRMFNIRSVIDLEERKMWLEISAEEGVA